MTDRDARLRVFHLARLATTLATRAYGPPGSAHPVFDPGDIRAFRAAFVQVEFEDPFRVTASESGVDFTVCGHLIGHIDADGAVRLARDGKFAAALPHVLAPSNTRTLAELAYQELRARLRDAYEARTGHLLIHDDTCGGYFHSRVRALRGLATRAVKRFCSCIAPEALAVLRRAQLAGVQHGCLVELVTGRFGLEWTQAIRAYPVLINWAFDPGVPLGIVDCVQSRAPLVPALANHFQITPAEVRRFRGLTPQRCGRNPGRGALRLILDLPPHLRPMRRRDWQAAFTLHCNLFSAFANTRHLVGNRQPLARTLTQGIKTPLGDLSVIEGLRHLNDPVVSIVSLGRQGGLILERLMQMTVQQMAAFSAQWHAESARVTQLARAEAARMLQVEGWDGALPSPVIHLPGDIVVTELTSPGQLVDEGAMQDHCVASYVGDCYVGRCRVLSVRCSSTGARTTAELVQRKVGARRVIVLAQHYGRSNEAPPPALDRALQALVRDLNAGAVTAWPRLDDPTEHTSWNSIQRRLEPWLLRRFGLDVDLAAAA
ncbi:hypothetical protein [Luteimonas sp. MHLX1A]|uniref:hypothetical protein n=1 Tax=Alterluteimonas muca TaxID=2878684 RepID=UPI001E4B1BF9|nr:hypothetical protein [Luteimonas sp. MHLX1A]MCD9046837.1 hypothetical protein [Luteimonas sp. MHLX1A]